MVSPIGQMRGSFLPRMRGSFLPRGDHAAAVGPLSLAQPRLAEIGGSHAQRDVFVQALAKVPPLCLFGGAIGVCMRSVFAWGSAAAISRAS